jgi:MFS superfamily sulfate permease-like transporter
LLRVSQDFFRNRLMTTPQLASRRRWLLPWVVGFQIAWIPRDLVAGVALGVVMIPQGMAYAELAGLPAVTGLYATMAAIIGYALLGSSRQLVIGPDSSTSTLLAAALITLAGAGASPERALAGAALIAIFAGIILLLAGFLKAGLIANFISKPVLVGYLNALAVTIVVKQLPKILGYKVEAEQVIPAAIETIRKLPQTQLLSVVIGVGCLLIIFGFQRFAPKIPGRFRRVWSGSVGVERGRRGPIRVAVACDPRLQAVGLWPLPAPGAGHRADGVRRYDRDF